MIQVDCSKKLRIIELGFKRQNIICGWVNTSHRIKLRVTLCTLPPIQKTILLVDPEYKVVPTSYNMLVSLLSVIHEASLSIFRYIYRKHPRFTIVMYRFLGVAIIQLRQLRPWIWGVREPRDPRGQGFTCWMQHPGINKPQPLVFYIWKIWPCFIGKSK